MAERDLTITIKQQGDDGVSVALWCPNFADNADCENVEEALWWARRRLEGVDPFEDYPDA